VRSAPAEPALALRRDLARDQTLSRDPVRLRAQDVESCVRARKAAVSLSSCAVT